MLEEEKSCLPEEEVKCSAHVFKTMLNTLVELYWVLSAESAGNIDNNNNISFICMTI